jgi:hypothetical protein
MIAVLLGRGRQAEDQILLELTARDDHLVRHRALALPGDKVVVMMMMMVVVVVMMMMVMVVSVMMMGDKGPAFSR